MDWLALNCGDSNGLNMPRVSGLVTLLRLLRTALKINWPRGPIFFCACICKRRAILNASTPALYLLAIQCAPEQMCCIPQSAPLKKSTRVENFITPNFLLRVLMPSRPRPGNDSRNQPSAASKVPGSSPGTARVLPGVTASFASGMDPAISFGRWRPNFKIVCKGYGGVLTARGKQFRLSSQRKPSRAR